MLDPVSLIIGAAAMAGVWWTQRTLRDLAFHQVCEDEAAAFNVDNRWTLRGLPSWAREYAMIEAHSHELPVGVWLAAVIKQSEALK